VKFCGILGGIVARALEAREPGLLPTEATFRLAAHLNAGRPVLEIAQHGPHGLGSLGPALERLNGGLRCPSIT